MVETNVKLTSVIGGFRAGTAERLVLLPDLFLRPLSAICVCPTNHVPMWFRVPEAWEPPERRAYGTPARKAGTAAGEIVSDHQSQSDAKNPQTETRPLC